MNRGTGDEGGVYVLEGANSFVSNAGIADHDVLFARTGDTGAVLVCRAAWLRDRKADRVSREADAPPAAKRGVVA